MADGEVVSRPAPVGYWRLRNGHVLTAWRRKHPSWLSPFQSHVGAIARLREKLGVYQGPEHRIADIALEPPQALRLSGGQPKTGHFHVLALNSLEHFIDTHIDPSGGSPESHGVLFPVGY